MATLQTLRNRGPLLIIVVGIALLAFIAGDLTKIFGASSYDNNVGIVGEEEVTAEEYSQAYNEFDLFCKVNGIKATGEEIRNAAWSLLTWEKTLYPYAEELGITVTDEEISYVLGNRPEIHQGIIPQARTCPFMNNGKFDLNILTSLLQTYEQLSEEGQLTEDVATLYAYWKSLERQIRLSLTTIKLQQLYAGSLIVNPAIEEKYIKAESEIINAQVAEFPLDMQSVTVSDEEIAEYYNTNKRYRTDWYNTEETRDIKYVTYQVKPSYKDYEETRLAMKQCADTLRAGFDNYERIARITRSERLGSDLLATSDEMSKVLINNNIVLDEVVAAEANEVVEPFQVMDNDSEGKPGNYYYVIQNLEKMDAPQSVTLKYAVVTNKSKESLDASVDSLMTNLNNGGDFAELTSAYQIKNNGIKFSADSVLRYWIAGRNEDMTTGNISEETMKTYTLAELMMNSNAQKSIYNAETGVYMTENISDENMTATLVYQVVEKSDDMVTVYKPLVMRRKVELSNETYDNEYNEFCKFMANCNNIQELEKNAALSGKYAPRTKRNLTTLETTIGNVPETASFIKWIYNDSTQVGAISEIKKCGENDSFMVVALENVNHKGYMPLTQTNANGQLLYDLIKEEITVEKAAEKTIKEVEKMSENEILAQMGATGSLKYDTPTGAVAASLNPGETSKPFRSNYSVYVVKTISKNKNENANINNNAAREREATLLDYNAVLKVLMEKNPSESYFHKHE